MILPQEKANLHVKEEVVWESYLVLILMLKYQVLAVYVFYIYFLYDTSCIN